MKTISKYSFGIGDRFAHEGVNQLKALIQAERDFGVHFTPVWNKSNREHTIIGTEPMSTRREADEAVKALRHDEAEPLYNPSFRQLIHVSFKVAAELKDEFLPALVRSADVIGAEIGANIGARHVARLFN